MLSCGRQLRHLPKLRTCGNATKRRLPATQLRRCLANPASDRDEGKKTELAGSIASKYEIFPDDETQIFDVEQERERFREVTDESGRMEKQRPNFRGISPTCGQTGVIEVEELVDILRRENARDVFVVEVPKECNYVDYLVLATGRSGRHLRAIAEYVKQVYRYKIDSQGYVPRVEGAKSKEWMALDLGNIALHVFDESTRERFDLETLWSVGKEYDLLSLQNAEDEADPSVFLSKLTPLV